MKHDIAKFVLECIICQQVKRHLGKTHGFWMPLPIPKGHWEEISMDFITGLPTTSAHNDMIWTIVDRFSKQAYFISCKKTFTAPQVAKMFLVHLKTVRKDFLDSREEDSIDKLDKVKQVARDMRRRNVSS